MVFLFKLLWAPVVVPVFWTTSVCCRTNMSRSTVKSIIHSYSRQRDISRFNSMHDYITVLRELVLAIKQ